MWPTIQSYTRVCKVHFQVSIKSYHKLKNLFVFFSLHFASTHRRSTRQCTFVALHTVHSAHTVADSRPLLYSFIKCCYYYHCRRSQCYEMRIIGVDFHCCFAWYSSAFHIFGFFAVSLQSISPPPFLFLLHFHMIWMQCAADIVHVVCVHVSIYCVCSVCQR